MEEKEKIDGILKEALKLYQDGGVENWKKAIDLLNNAFLARYTGPEEEVAEALRLKGWCYYYLGTKGEKRMGRENLELSIDFFSQALRKTKDPKKKISIVNGLPLSYWVYGDKGEAMGISHTAIQEFPDEPSVWNTRSILLGWAGEHSRKVDACEKAYQTALAREDYRTAGSSKKNKADALVALGWTEEAEREYTMAVGLYVVYEKTSGQSAEFHIEGALDKLAALKEQ